MPSALNEEARGGQICPQSPSIVVVNSCPRAVRGFTSAFESGDSNALAGKKGIDTIISRTYTLLLSVQDSQDRMDKYHRGTKFPG